VSVVKHYTNSFCLLQGLGWRGISWFTSDTDT